MIIRFTKNASGWWTVGKKRELPTGSISADGSVFQPAHYPGMTVEREIVVAIAEMMNRISDGTVGDEDVIEKKA